MPAERLLCMDDVTRPPPRRAHCCADMTAAASFRCAEHESVFDCGDAVVWYSPVFDEFGLIVHDGSGTYLSIAHCPWCGAALPEPKRDRWFAEMEARGITDFFGDGVPEAYRSDAWWRIDQTSP